MLYQLDKTNPSAFHDITTGNNGYAAGTGYDLVTGLGSPVVNVLVPAMSGSTTTSVSNLVFQQSPTSGTAGTALGTVTVAVENQNGQIVTTDNSTITLSIASGPGGFATGSTVSAKAVNGVATFTNLLLNSAGSYTLRSQRRQLDESVRRKRSRSMPPKPRRLSFNKFLQRGLSVMRCPR